jgi:hypothetical protein
MAAASTRASCAALTPTVTACSQTLRSSLAASASLNGVTVNKATSRNLNLAIADHAAVAVTVLAPRPALAATATVPSLSPALADHAAVAVTVLVRHPALAEAATDPSPSPVADHAAVAETDPAPHPATDPHIIRATALAVGSR